MNIIVNFARKVSSYQCRKNLQSLSSTGRYLFRSCESRVRPFCRAVSTQKFSHSWNKQTAESKTYFAYPSVERDFSDMAQQAKQAKEPFQRLPATVRPVNYDIKLKPNLKTFTFEGSESISVEVKNATKEVIVNSADIEISSVTYQADGASAEVTGAVEFKKEAETVTFTFPEELQAGKGVLKVVFTGELNDKMKGFYRSKYTGPDGEDRYGAVTQFEASDARRSFPCWDEPALKATFDITLVVPKNRVALSNMPVKEETDDASDSSLKVVSYERSPIMSTYLLAYVVGEYDFVEGTDANGVLVRVYTPVGKKEQGQFALDAAVKTLPFYKDYFGIAYPLPKMDLIAIADFSAGAMENWGLVTYRETALLIDPKHSSSKTKQWVALVVGHELAHQWFGNLVTMEWWTHLWLNEGFASWIEYLSVDYIFKEFDIWTQFVNQDLGRALELDALHTSHPIEVPVGPPSEIDEIFDAISYSKGASVIRMLHEYLGDKDYRAGLSSYLQKFAYKNTFTEDLWESLEAASGKPVAEVMDTWTKQMGFPVIQASEEQKGDNRVLTLKQEKFNADGQTKEGESTTWMVPVGISTTGSPGAPAQTVLMKESEMEVTMDNVKDDDWVKLNFDSVGVFRVQYTSAMLKKLIPAIKDKTLGPRDRLGIQNDLFALCRAGMTPTTDVLEVVEAYINEDNYTVWSDMSMNLSQIAILLQYTDASEAYKGFAKFLYAPIAKQLGWEQKKGEGVLDAMLRDLVLLKLGRYGDEATVAEARKRFAAHCDGSKEIPADLRSTVYTTVLSNGDEDTFNQMLKLYDQTDLQEEKVRIARLLGAVKDEKLIQRVLDFAMSEKVRNQDTVFVLAGVTSSKAGREIGWNFLKSNWKELHNRYEGGFLLARMVKSMTENFASEEMAVEVENFFKANPAPAAERSVQQSVENIRLNAKWMDKEAALVSKFLKDRPAA